MFIIASPKAILLPRRYLRFHDSDRWFHMVLDMKSVDWKARRAEKLAICPIDVMNEVLARLAPLLGY